MGTEKFSASDAGEQDRGGEARNLEGQSQADIDAYYKAFYGKDADPNAAYIEALMGIGETASVDYEAMYSSMADMYAKISTMNEDKFNKYWPESMTEGIAAGKVYDEAGRAQSLQATKFNQSLADISNSWLKDTAAGGNEFMRGQAGQMNEWMMGQVGDVNKFNSEQFYAALEKAMPGMMDTAGDYKDTVDQMLSGQLPDAVKSEIAQAGAERGLSAGIYGGAQDNAQLRDLGISRLQYLQAGQAQVPALMGLTQALTATVATPNIYQNVMMTPTLSTPQPTYNTPSNIPGIAGNYLSALMGSTMMQPQAGLQQVGNMAQIQNQTNMANTQLQYSKAMSMMNYGTQQQQMAQNYNMFQQQQSAASSNSLLSGLMGLGGTIGGALLGGPIGAAIGGSLGGMAGNQMNTPSTTGLNSGMGYYNPGQYRGVNY